MTRIWIPYAINTIDGSSCDAIFCSMEFHSIISSRLSLNSHRNTREASVFLGRHKNAMKKCRYQVAIGTSQLSR